MNALGALGKKDALRNVRQRAIQALESHLSKVPEDARARILLAGDYAQVGPRRGRRCARRTWRWCCGRTRRSCSTTPPAPSASSSKKAEALDALRKAWDAGFRDADWARRDPDLALLHGDPEFERLYPATPATG